MVAVFRPGRAGKWGCGSCYTSRVKSLCSEGGRRRGWSVRNLRRIAATVLSPACLLLLAVGPVFGLDPERRLTDYVVRTWGIEAGLPQYSVNAVLQDRQGYLWAGTQEGLVRFDGARFTVYDMVGVEEMRSSFIQVLLEDSAGRLWMGTNGGGLLRLEEGRFRRFGAEHGLPSEVVLALAESEDGSLLVGTERGLVQVRNDTVEVPAAAEHLPHRKVASLLVEPGGGLWVGTYGGLLHHTAWSQQVLTTEHGLPDNVILTLFLDREARIWVGTYDGGAAVREAGRWRRLAGGDRLGSRRITALFQDRQGTLWIGTHGGGLARLSGGRLERMTERDGLAGNVVMSIAQDREGSLWVGTETGGLTQLRDGKFVPVTVRHGLSHAVVFAVLEDRQGRIWMGTASGGLNRLHDGRIEAFGPTTGFPSEHVGGMAEGRDGTLWVGIRTGLVRGYRGRWEEVRLPGEIRNPFVWAIHEDEDGTLWIGTDGGGLYQRLPDLSWKVHNTGTGMPGNLVRAIVRDRRGDLWVGTAAGLGRFRDGVWTSFTRLEGLPNDYIVTLFLDRRGVLWAGTLTGLARVKDGQVRAFPRESGVPMEAVLSIQEDELGFLWMGFNRGLVRVPRMAMEAWQPGAAEPVPLTRFGTSDGMPSAECNGGSQPSSWRSRDGRLWFPTVHGVAVVDPSRLPANTVPPPVLVEELVADGRPLPLKGRVTVPPGTRRLEIRYTALSLVDPDRVLFQHQLVGFDPEPLEVGGQRFATFTGLRPGEYTFWVTACNEDGLWNRDGVSVSLWVRPFFWQTWVFRGLLVLLALAAMAAFFGRRVRRIRRHEQELERLVKERTDQLRQTNRQLEDQRRRLAQANRMLQRLSVIDPLTAIANRRRFDETLGVEWRRALRQERPLALLMVDIDNFKAFNDRYGHQAGDACLQQVAEALASAASRPGDLVARYGGEEFAILLADTDAAGAMVVAEKVRQSVEDLAIPHEASQVKPVVTVSVGLAAEFPQIPSAAETLIARADAALYEAKAEGRNKVVAAR